MGAHWRLAFKCAAWTAGLAVPVALEMAGDLGTDYGAESSAPETEERRVEV